jgi:phosphorylcholine metabolism protein LicD
MSRGVAEAFDTAGVTYWMDYGTLLGAFRNPLTTWADYPWLPQEDRPEGPLAPGIIPHDKDADWGVLMKDWRAAEGALRSRECKHHHLLLRKYRGSIKVRPSRTNRTNLDLFFWVEHHVRTGRMFRRGYASVDAYKGKHFDKADLFPLQPMEWEGLQLPAPKDPEAWLEFRYGPSWHTPIPANHDGVRR